MPLPRPIDPFRPDPALLGEAAAWLRRGRAVVVPTETVYGVAVCPAVPGAMECLYAAKGRDPAKPVAYFLPAPAEVHRLGISLSPPALRLAQKYWPGPLTLVVPRGGESVGIRVPDHPVALALLALLNEPLAVTSANRSGEPAAITAAQAAAALGEAVALVLDAGPSPGGVASTVVRVAGDEIEILRAGAISEAEIRRTAGRPLP